MGRALVEDNDWAGVQDPRKRKQIQDRLAQRARRRRLAAQKSAVTPSSPPPSPRRSPIQSHSHASDDASSSNSSLSDGGVDIDTRNLPVLRVPRDPVWYQATIPTHKDPQVCVEGSISGSVYAALFNNGAMMGLSCSTTVPCKSKPVDAGIPQTLRPTVLQLTSIHPTWIDRFPFPKMRDNMITLIGVIDEEEFLADLFCLTSFTLVPGAAPWDPRAWKIGKEFSAKWGYLFY